MALIRKRQRKQLGDAAGGRDFKELGEAAGGLAVGAEDDLFAIGRPGYGDIDRRMIGHALGDAACDRNGEYVSVSVVFT